MALSTTTKKAVRVTLCTAIALCSTLGAGVVVRIFGADLYSGVMLGLASGHCGAVLCIFAWETTR